MLPTFARALVTPSSTSFSCCAKPFTELTRFGTRSARRWYWLTTSDQPDLTCSSSLWIVLYPQLVRLNVASAASTVKILRIRVSPFSPSFRGGRACGRTRNSDVVYLLWIPGSRRRGAPRNDGDCCSRRSLRATVIFLLSHS